MKIEDEKIAIDIYLDIGARCYKGEITLEEAQKEVFEKLGLIKTLQDLLEDFCK
jgi:hypothetical protein